MASGPYSSVVQFLHRISAPVPADATDVHLLKLFTTNRDEGAFIPSIWPAASATHGQGRSRSCWHGWERADETGDFVLAWRSVPP